MTIRGRLPRARRGAATVEFALLLPVLLLFAAIAVDFARVYQYQQALSLSARNGALYEAVSAVSQSSPYESVVAAALADAELIRDKATVESRRTVDRQGEPCVAVTVRYPFKTTLRVPGVANHFDLSRTVGMRVRDVPDEDDE